MEKKQLDRALNGGIAVNCDTVGEYTNLLKLIKDCGGKWINGDKIVYNESDLTSKKQNVHVLYIDKDYTISYISGMCLHFGAFPVVHYKKFATDKAVLRIDEHIKTRQR
jgi:hypothetical protein